MIVQPMIKRPMVERPMVEQPMVEQLYISVQCFRKKSVIIRLRAYQAVFRTVPPIFVKEGCLLIVRRRLLL